MMLNVRLAENSDHDAWDEYVFRHAEGLAYHQFAWKISVSEAYGFDSRYLLAERDGAICGILPLIVFKRPFSQGRYVSLPYCDIGGCLADDEEIVTRLVEKAKEIGVTDNVVGAEFRTGLKHAPADNAHYDNPKVRMVLKLPDSSELLLKSLNAKLRSQVNKPIRDGLTTQLGGIELLREFYRVFAAHMRDLGSPVHSRKFIESVMNNYAERARICLVLTSDSEVAAVGIVLMHADIVSIPWASSLRLFNRLNANMLLYWTLLAFAADNGYRYFDFGRSTPGEGTYRFKQQWGAQEAPLRWIEKSYIRNGGTKQSTAAHSSLRRGAEALWRMLPVPVCNVVGPLIRKHISL